MAAREGKCKAAEIRAVRESPLWVMAGLVPATPLNKALPCPVIGVAGSSPAMTLM
jgi:hypothetical protein